MEEQEESERETKNQDEKDIEAFDYTHVDPLTAIGYSAEPGDIYYISPPQELSTYPMYIENPHKVDKKVGAYIAYTLNGTDITDQMSRRYSDFFALYEKLCQKWPGIYIPRIPGKKITKNTSRKMIKTRMRLLNRFCLNLSNIDYLYSSDETALFKGNTTDLANAITKLPDFTIEEYAARLKDVFPQYNENYDVIIGKGKINEFDGFLKKSLKNIEVFQKSVESAAEKREHEKKKYVELINGFVDYEKNCMLSYSDDNDSCIIINNPSYKELAEKIAKFKNEMINPYTAFKEWLEEEILDAEAMSIAIKGINEFMEKEDKYRQKLETVETDLKRLEEGGSSIKTLFKKKEDVIAKKQKEKEEIQAKYDNLSLIVKIVADNMENQIEEFKHLKTQTYYKYLKIFAILQRESNRVVRELWTLVRTALNEVAPNASQANEDYSVEPIKNDQNDEEQADADGDGDGDD
jgi:hypothetical protein